MEFSVVEYSLRLMTVGVGLSLVLGSSYGLLSKIWQDSPVFKLTKVRLQWMLALGCVLFLGSGINIGRL